MEFLGRRRHFDPSFDVTHIGETTRFCRAHHTLQNAASNSLCHSLHAHHYASRVSFGALSELFPRTRLWTRPQNFGSWMGDEAKGLIVTLITNTILLGT